MNQSVNEMMIGIRSTSETLALEWDSCRGHFFTPLACKPVPSIGLAMDSSSQTKAEGLTP